MEPLNTEWNRKIGMLPGIGKVTMLTIRHGIAFFTWSESDGKIHYYQCDEGLLPKHFHYSKAGFEKNDDKGKSQLDDMLKAKIKFLKYPFEAAKLH